MSTQRSYGSILKSSSIVGGAHALTYLLGLVRVKLIAVLLGPTGVGLLGIFGSIVELVGTATSLGIGSSGVREVARASAKGDDQKAALIARGLQLTCWAAGLFGWLVAVAAARPLSRFFFSSDGYGLSIAALGLVLVFNSANAGLNALLQGRQRIRDIAVVTVAATVANTMLAVAMYWVWGENGIVPALIACAASSLCITWFFVRRLGLPPVRLNFSHGLAIAKRLVKLGSAFAWSAVLTAGLDIVTRGMIVRDHGVEAAGFYQAAWSLSGLFASFVLTAMGTDYYPRLTKVIREPVLAVQTVNEQSEIGMLLALPGMLITLAFAPTIVTFLYSKEFVQAGEILPWFTLGVFARVISWPMGYVLLAAGEARWFAATQTAYLTLQLAMVTALVPPLGPIGAAYAFLAMYVLHVAGMYVVARRFIGFRWSAPARRLLVYAALFVISTFVVRLVPSKTESLIAGAALAATGTAFAGLELMKRLSPTHRLIRLLRWMRPG